MLVVAGFDDDRPRRGNGEEEEADPAQVLLPRSRSRPAARHVQVVAGHKLGSRKHGSC